MLNLRTVLAIASALVLASPCLADADKPTDLGKIVVVGGRIDGGVQSAKDSISPVPPQLKAVAPDTAALLESAPGAAIVRNGPQTGMLQINGLSGQRVKVLVNGMPVTPAGPNRMDPPLSYLDPEQTDAISIYPGITPVYVAGDALGGTVLVDSPPLEFGWNDALAWFGDAGAGWDGENAARNLFARVETGTESNALGVMANHREGSDLLIPGGRAADTGFTSDNYQLRGAHHGPAGDWRLTFMRHEADDTGTPVLPMDMLRTTGNLAALGYSKTVDNVEWQARVFHHASDHDMDNFSLRPAGMMQMQVAASDAEQGGKVGAAWHASTGTWRLGMDYHALEQDAVQSNPVSGDEQQLFRNATRDRSGVYAGWEAHPGDAWHTDLGTRVDQVTMNADAIEQRFMMTPATDQAAFNNADRSQTDTDWTLTALAEYRISVGTQLQLGAARQMQAPSILERYLWTPSSASGGLADGRSYIGDPNLAPETANILRVGVDWQAGAWRFNPVLFHNRIDNYIQGAPGRYAPNPAVLQFTNLGSATLDGANLRWGWLGSQRHWELNGTLSYTRGRNADNGDNLYRLAPLRSFTSLVYHNGRWRAALGLELVARQDRVSAYNDELPSPGYGVVNLSGSWMLGERVCINAGIQNLLDKRYAPHLNGVNRVDAGDVAVGERMPEAGRALYARVQVGF